MRTSAFARGGALLTAATLAITLSSGPASAHDSHTAAVGPTVGSARHTASAPAKPHFSGSIQRKGTSVHTESVADLTKVSASSTVLFQPEGSSIVVAIDGSGWEGVDHVDLSLTVNGVQTGPYTWYHDDQDNVDFINIPNSVGVGKATISSETIYYNDGVTAPTVDSTPSNTFYVRRATTSTATGKGSNYPFFIVVGSKHINFHANHWKVFRPSTGTFVPLSSIQLQYRKDHRWVTLKTIKLSSSSGSGSYTKTRGAKHRYRLYYATTDTTYGSYTGATDNL